jgi:hypothetical protein
MVDGIGEKTELWRGRAAYQAGPSSANTALPDTRTGGRGNTPPGLPVSAFRFLRYQTTLPLLPGDRLATVVAARRPDAAELLRKASPHWEKLRQWGARTRELLKTDIEVMSDLLVDAAREFHGLLEAGLHKEAKAISAVMDFIERVIAELPDYPALEDAVIESARRTLAFVEHAAPGFDFLAAGGLSVVSERGNASVGFSEPDSRGIVHRTTPRVSPISRGHPFLGSWGIDGEMQTGDLHGIDPETGEKCWTARGGRELGILLADLCKDGDVSLSVKSCVPHGKVSAKLGLRRDRLATSRRMVETVAVTLRRGTSPEEALIQFGDTASNYEFPVWTKPFFVSRAVSYSHAQDFIVDSGFVLFSYVSGVGSVDGSRRLEGQVLRLTETDATNIDSPLIGVLVTDRAVAAQLARRVLRHSRSAWGKIAPPHRVRVALTSEGEAVVVAVHLCGSEPYFGIPYDRVLLALKNRRDRFLSNLYRHPVLVRKVGSRQHVRRPIRGFPADRDEPVSAPPALEQEQCERIAKRLLSGENFGMRRLSTIDEFMTEVALGYERSSSRRDPDAFNSIPDEFDFEG